MASADGSSSKAITSKKVSVFFPLTYWDNMRQLQALGFPFDTQVRQPTSVYSKSEPDKDKTDVGPAVISAALPIPGKEPSDRKFPGSAAKKTRPPAVESASSNAADTLQAILPSPASSGAQDTDVNMVLLTHAEIFKPSQDIEMTAQEWPANASKANSPLEDTSSYGKYLDNTYEEMDEPITTDQRSASPGVLSESSYAKKDQSSNDKKGEDEDEDEDKDEGKVKDDLQVIEVEAHPVVGSQARRTGVPTTRKVADNFQQLSMDSPPPEDRQGKHTCQP